MLILSSNTLKVVSVTQSITSLVRCWIFPVFSVQMCPQSKRHDLVCTPPSPTHPSSAQTCNSHTFFSPLLPRWAAGHNVSLFFCRPLSHAFCVTGWQAGRRSRFRWSGLAQDELWGTSCQDKWTKQYILPSSILWLRSGCVISCKATFFFPLPDSLPVPKQHLKEWSELKMFEEGWLNSLLAKQQ